MSTGTLLPETEATQLSARQPHTLEVYALRQKATAVKPNSGHLPLPLWRLGIPCPETFDQTPLTPRGSVAHKLLTPWTIVTCGCFDQHTHPRKTHQFLPTNRFHIHQPARSAG